MVRDFPLLQFYAYAKLIVFYAALCASRSSMSKTAISNRVHAAIRYILQILLAPPLPLPLRVPVTDNTHFRNKIDLPILFQQH